MSQLSIDERQRLTLFYDQWRMIGTGLLETIPTTFLLGLAIVLFEPSSTVLGILSIGGAPGLLLSPLFLWGVRKLRVHVNHAAGAVFLFGSVVLVFMSYFLQLDVYLLGMILVHIVVMGSIPLVTQIYGMNYKKEARGTLFSRTVFTRVCVAATFAYAAGEVIDHDPEKADDLIFLFAIAMGFCGYCLWRMPGGPLPDTEKNFPYQSLKVILEDATFRWVLASWMLMGIGNLMVLQLRVAWLMDPVHGNEYSMKDTSLLLGTTVMGVQLVSTMIWGRLFDRLNFFLLRAVLNLIFIFAQFFFFLGGSFTTLVIGCMFYGLAMGGGNVAWSLWVTKMAPPEKTADYMSAHTFTTGVRALFAPFLGIQLAVMLPIQWVVGLSTVLIIVSCLMLVPEIRGWKKQREGTPLTEDFSE